MSSADIPQTVLGLALFFEWNRSGEGSLQLLLQWNRSGEGSSRARAKLGNGEGTLTEHTRRGAEAEDHQGL